MILGSDYPSLGVFDFEPQPIEKNQDTNANNKEKWRAATDQRKRFFYPQNCRYPQLRNEISQIEAGD
jgi:hypothetical protein